MSATLLVVDDSVAIRGVIAFVLRGSGYTCLEAADGQEALDVLDKNPIDGVISDLWMPGMNGLGLLESVRKDGLRRFLPFLVLTTDSDPEMHRQLLEAGATSVISKPVAPDKLLGAVSRALAR